MVAISSAVRLVVLLRTMPVYANGIDGTGAFGCRCGPLTGFEDQEDTEGGNKEQTGTPGVHAQPQNRVGIVGAHQFEDKTAGGVQDDVEGENRSGPELVPAVQEQQRRCGGQASQRLVDERRLEVSEDLWCAVGSRHCLAVAEFMVWIWSFQGRSVGSPYSSLLNQSYNWLSVTT